MGGPTLVGSLTLKQNWWRRPFLRMIAVTMLMMPLGCGRSVGPRFVPVEGRVSLGGQPLTIGTIHFVPDTSQGNDGPMSRGVLRSDGSFSMHGPGRHIGAVVGPHRVYLTMPLPVIATPTPVMVNGEVVVRDPPRGGADATVPKVPKKYLQPETSGWTAIITEGENNVFQFEIP